MVAALEDCHEHEGRKGEQENTVDGEDCRRQYHEEGQDGQHVAITFALCRKESNHHQEKQEVDQRGKKAAREQEIVGQVEGQINQGQVICPTLRNGDGTPGCEQITAEQQGDADQQDSGKIESTGAGQSAEAREHQQIE